METETRSDYQKRFSVLQLTKDNTILCTEPKCLHFGTYEKPNYDHVFRCMNKKCKHFQIYFTFNHHQSCVLKDVKPIT